MATWRSEFVHPSVRFVLISSGMLALMSRIFCDFVSQNKGHNHPEIKYCRLLLTLYLLIIHSIFPPNLTSFNLCSLNKQR
jgi:hypothetical protein